MAAQSVTTDKSLRTRDILLVVGFAVLCTYLFQQLFTPKMVNDSGLVATLLTQIASPFTMIVVAIVLALASSPLEKLLSSNRIGIIAFAVLGIFGMAASNLAETPALFYVGCILATVFFGFALYFFISQSEKLEEDALSAVCMGAPAIACLYLAIQSATGFDDTLLTIVSPLILAAVAWPLMEKGSPATETEEHSEIPDGGKSRPISSWSVLVALALFSLICALLNTAYVLLAPSAVIGENAADPLSRGLMYLAALVFFVVGLALFAIRRKMSLESNPLHLFLVLCIFIVCYMFIALATGFYLDQKAVMPIISIRTAVEGTLLLALAASCRSRQCSAAQAAATLLAIVAVTRLLKIASTCIGKTCGVSFDGLIVPFALSAAFCVIALVTVGVLSMHQKAPVPQEAADTSEPGQASAEPPQTAAFPESASKTLATQFALTDREIEVVKCLVERLSTKESAERLFISTSTLYTHQKKIYRKTGVHSKEELLDLINQLS